MGSYAYNSFELTKQRMAETDMLNLADLIHNLPLQKEIDIDGKKFKNVKYGKDLMEDNK